MNSPQADKRTASQRIEDLERGLMSIYQTADNMARDMGTIKEAIKLLGNKLDSVVKASNNGEKLTDEVIARIMVENNVEELKGKVETLVKQGILVAAEEVTATSFVVGRELAEDGTVQNPRMQFIVSALNVEVKGKFPGAKVGQTLELQEGKWKFEIQEVYNIVTPQAPVLPDETKVEAVMDSAPAETAQAAPAPVAQAATADATTAPAASTPAP